MGIVVRWVDIMFKPISFLVILFVMTAFLMLINSITFFTSTEKLIGYGLVFAFTILLVYVGIR